MSRPGTFECPDCLGDCPNSAEECPHCGWISKELDPDGLGEQAERAKTAQDLPQFVGAQDIFYFPATAYIDERSAIKIFAHTFKHTRVHMVNGVVPLHMPRRAILAYLKNFPLTTEEQAGFAK